MMENGINSILLIDDDQDDRFFFATALEEVDPNIRLLTAMDGHDGLKKLHNCRPGLILLDLVMPHLNGLGFLNEFKKIKDRNDIPVMIYTSALGVYEEKDLLKMGAREVWLKPEDFDGTVRRIREMLGKEVYLKSA